jgi:hypothetical protein
MTAIITYTSQLNDLFFFIMHPRAGSRHIKIDGWTC